MYRRCLRLLGDREEARDATQAVFVQVLRSGKRFDDVDAAIAWLHSVSTNYCLNQRRNARRRGAFLEVVAVQEEPRDEGADASVPARQLVGRALETTDEDGRRIALEVLVGGHEQKDVARELGVSEKTVQRKLKRFLDRARELLKGG